MIPHADRRHLVRALVGYLAYCGLVVLWVYAFSGWLIQGMG